MTTITEFISARLADDEQTAQARIDTPRLDWVEVRLSNGQYAKQSWPVEVGRDPARALLEVKAWRGVIDYLDPDGQYDREIFADIAAIWNTHADYQAEWAP